MCNEWCIQHQERLTSPHTCYAIILRVGLVAFCIHIFEGFSQPVTTVPYFHLLACLLKVGKRTPVSSKNKETEDFQSNFSDNFYIQTNLNHRFSTSRENNSAGKWTGAALGLGWTAFTTQTFSFLGRPSRKQRKTNRRVRLMT